MDRVPERDRSNPLNRASLPECGAREVPRQVCTEPGRVRVAVHIAGIVRPAGVVGAAVVRHVEVQRLAGRQRRERRQVDQQGGAPGVAHDDLALGEVRIRAGAFDGQEQRGVVVVRRAGGVRAALRVAERVRVHAALLAAHHELVDEGARRRVRDRERLPVHDDRRGGQADGPHAKPVAAREEARVGHEHAPLRRELGEVRGGRRGPALRRRRRAAQRDAVLVDGEAVRLAEVGERMVVEVAAADRDVVSVRPADVR